MNQNPDQRARDEIDSQLRVCSWVIRHKKNFNLSAGVGVAFWENQTTIDPPDYILFVNQKLVGLIETQSKEGRLMMVEDQSAEYAHAKLKYIYNDPLPFVYESTGELTRFTEYRDPKPHSCQWGFEKVEDVYTSVEYSSAAKSHLTGQVPVLPIGNIKNEGANWSDLGYTDDYEEIKRYLLKKNDVLFNRTNSAKLVGKTAIYNGERIAIFTGYLIRINQIENKIDANYMTCYLNSEKARSFGVNQSNINGTKLKTYPLTLPQLKEQQQFVQEIESLLSACDRME